MNVDQIPFDQIGTFGGLVVVLVSALTVQAKKNTKNTSKISKAVERGIVEHTASSVQLHEDLALVQQDLDYIKEDVNRVHSRLTKHQQEMETKFEKNDKDHDRLEERLYQLKNEIHDSKH